MLSVLETGGLASVQRRGHSKRHSDPRRMCRMRPDCYTQLHVRHSIRHHRMPFNSCQAQHTVCTYGSNEPMHSFPSPSRQCWRETITDGIPIPGAVHTSEIFEVQRRSCPDCGARVPACAWCVPPVKPPLKARGRPRQQKVRGNLARSAGRWACPGLDNWHNSIQHIVK